MANEEPWMRMAPLRRAIVYVIQQSCERYARKADHLEAALLVADRAPA